MMEPEKPERFGYFFQIPIKAEVKKVQISMLSSSVQEKIRQLGGRTKASYVVVVSPITIHKLPKSHKSRTTAAEHSPVTMSDTSQSPNRRSMGKADKQTKKDLGTYLVPVKCSKDIALTILQLAQTSKEDKSSSESESSNFSNCLVLNRNLQMIEMKATTLYIYRNIMYLLPKSQEATSNEKSEAEKSEATEPQARAKLRNRKYKHKSLGCVTLRSSSFLQQQDRRIVGSVTEKSATIVNSCNKERCDEMKSIDVGPSSGSSTTKSLQMSFWEQSERQIKRKLPYLSNEQPFIKKTHQSDSGDKQDSIVAKNVLVRSPLQTHPSSSDAPSPPSPQESPASFSHEETSPYGYLSDSGAKQDSTVAKNVLDHSPLQTHPSSSDAPSPPSLQESPASFSHEETSPCGYLSVSGAKQDSTVAKNVLTHYPLQIHLSSSDASSPPSPEESPASFSHEETSPCGYLSGSGAKQDSTAAKNVLVHSPLQTHPSSSDAPSPPSPQESPASFSHEETSPCGYLSDSGAKQDSIVAKNVLTHYPLQPHSLSSAAPSPPSLQESPTSFSFEETSPCGYLSDSGAKQDSTVAKNVLDHSPLQTHPSSSDAPSPPSPHESPASFSHEETSPCGYLSDSGAKQDSTVAKNVLVRSPLQIHLSSSDAPSPPSPEESPASFSHEETSPCGYLSDSGAKQDSTVAKNVLDHFPLQTHPSSSDAPSPPSPQESPASFSHEETSPCGYLSDSAAKQDSTAAKNVLVRSPLQIHLSSSDAPSPPSPEESPASFSHEESSPCGYLSDSGAKQDSTVAKNVLTHYPLRTHSPSSDAPSPPSPKESPASFSHEETPPRQNTTDLERLSSSSNIPQHAAPIPLGYDPTCADNMSPPHLKAKSSPCWSEFTTGSKRSNDPDKTSSASEPSLMFNQLRSEQPFFLLDIDDTTRDEKRQKLFDRVIELKKKVEEMQQK